MAFIKNKMNDYVVYIILLLLIIFIPIVPQQQLLGESFAVSSISTLHYK